MTTRSRLFMSGRSQAVRIPARLRLQADTVRIEKIGDGLWLQPEQEQNQNLGQWLQAFYDRFEPFPDDFLSDRDTTPPQERNWN